MSLSAVISPPAADAASRTGAARIPWEVPALVGATTLVAIGLSWDISWHQTIGRDSFWTPAHIAIYLGGALSGFIAGWLAIRATFLTAPGARDGAVTIAGGRAPYGAWIVIWGAAAMLASGPFDNWWHNAYGLDVKIISPPHVVLFAGILAIRLGVWLMTLREQNRPDAAPAARWLYLYMGGLVEVCVAGVFLSEFIANREHGNAYLLIAAAVLPLGLAAAAPSVRFRWGVTGIAAVYMAYNCAMLWILPLFPGTPHLGPIYRPVTHMVPPPFPQWIVLPAIAIDVARRYLPAGPQLIRTVLTAVLVSAAFFVFFFPAQWLFSSFILSPSANNWFFGGGRMWGYNAPPPSEPRLTQFWNPTGWPLESLALAALIAFAISLLGAWLGGAMSRVRR